ncbi:Transcriptional regulator, AraC family [Labilithrix luteola]|uniref:Transcriptional regulator, AraC family n=1 Tax=Labilithrix luteola TaxID=1391654 RepID=A0A0K1Q0C1_9BACT|nr:Transcriptional regulator, AraC family [Labilithrix luteola]
MLTTASDRFTLVPGDLALLRRGLSHALNDPSSMRTVAAAELYAKRGDRPCGGLHRFGGDGTEATLGAASFSLDERTADLLQTSLPDVLVVKARDEVTADWRRSTFELITSDVHGARVDPLVAAHLIDALFLDTLQSYASSNATGGWLRALDEPGIGVALRLLHERPAARWTVEELARAAAMSRSSFAARFTSVIGLAPMTYLVRHRMHVAAEMLATGNVSTDDAASAVGYETSSAFVKAFRRWFGKTPSEHRRHARGRSG